jgi:hypothetical protein
MAQLDSSLAIGKMIDQGTEAFGRFYSVYRGIVTDNTDPEQCCVLGITIPSIQGGLSVRAYPKGQHGADATGFKYFMPSIGDVVYVSFELGDLSQPLWEYHGWGYRECPYPLIGSNKAGIVTPNGNYVILDEDEDSLIVHFKGNILLKTESNITIDSDGVTVLHSKGEVLLQSETRTILNGEDHDGLVNVLDLTEKLNQLVQELDQLKQQINLHTHTSANPGSPSSPPINQITQTFSQFKAEDYKDDNCVH